VKASANTINERSAHHNRPLDELCREALNRVERALQMPPERVTQEADFAENAVVRLRDRLIDRLREEGASADAARLRADLEQVNAALSLVVGVDNPRASIQRDLLKQARDALQKLLDQGFPAEPRRE
jgi:hypothetical protein